MTINWAQIVTAAVIGFLIAVLLVDPVKMLRDRALRASRRQARRWWRRIRPPSHIPVSFHFGPIDTGCKVVLGDGVHPFSRIACSFDASVPAPLPEAAEFKTGIEDLARKEGWHDGEILQLLSARQTENAAETERYLELVVARSQFFYFCASNLELDSQLKSGGSLRSTYLDGSNWTQPVKSLGNGFSVNLIVTTSDNQLLLAKRTETGLTTYPNAWMVSVGGYVMNRDLPRDEDERYRDPFRAAVREAMRELKLDLDQLAVNIRFTSLTVDTRLSGWYLLGHAALPLTATDLGRLIGEGTLEREIAVPKFLPLDADEVLAWMTKEPGPWVPGALVCLYHLLESVVGRAALEAAVKRKRRDLKAVANLILNWPSKVVLTGTPTED